VPEIYSGAITMQRLLMIAALVFSSFAMAQEEKAAMSAQSTTTASPTMITIHTNRGVIKAELYQDKAPKSVENFLQYARDGFYEGTIFHRVISDFMIQGGGFNQEMQQKPTRAAIENEADNGLSNLRGTLAMARTPAPHSATAQFFINVQDNGFLDHKGKTSPNSWGYAVFGKVTEGLEVVDDIRFAETTRFGPHSDVPAEAVIIEKVEIDGEGA
jgi:cyclophilin family peptidyl-prolyl cis-trans isomerase